ncbi:gp37 [Mycobacterium phage PBI1]|uniref:Uncharacterized protein n=3 Tax=Plotvirus TaxID=2169613 RepID=B5U3H9_9CAUD|nr:gp37 [Mycobacterium phage PBI1]ABD58453.1 hypothetical protein PBI_PBI1_37 [Mycobacterium phage PBI1]ACD49623.1 hypothetical protein Adjutor_38 [Mycobacterium phage Adjutor]ACI06325.1 hypothetical protein BUTTERSCOTCH_37 [Mycobacterium phage Butterscotch]
MWPGAEWPHINHASDWRTRWGSSAPRFDREDPGQSRAGRAPLMFRPTDSRRLRSIFRKPRRIDHGRMYVSCMMGLWVWSLSLLVIGPVPNSTIDELTDYVQNILASCIFIGSFVCLCGIAIGTKYVLPKADIRLCYRFSLWGIPALAGSVGTYAWAIAHNTGSFWVSAYAASIGTFICLGIVWNGLDLLFEIARLNEEINYLKYGAGSEERLEDRDDERKC